MVAPLRVGSGIEIGGGIKVGIPTILTTTSAQNYAADGPVMSTFRVLNRGGNWDEFFANWPNSSWSCDQLPGSIVTNMTIPNPSEPDSPEITIIGGTFILNSFYSFTGLA